MSFTAVSTDVPVAPDVHKQSVVTAAFTFLTNVYENDFLNEKNIKQKMTNSIFLSFCSLLASSDRRRQRTDGELHQ